MKKTKLTRSLLAACSIVALTAVMYGCVHDGGDDDTMDTGMEMPDPTPQEQITALQGQINALRAQLGLPAIDIAQLTGSVSDLQGQVDNLQGEIDKRDTAANTAKLEGLFAAAKQEVTGAPAYPADEAFRNVSVVKGAVTVKFGVDQATADAATTNAVTLADSESYSSQESADRVLFTKHYEERLTSPSDVLTLDDAMMDGEDAEAADFPLNGGTATYTDVDDTDDDLPGHIAFRGTLMGATGTFMCGTETTSAACTVSEDGGDFTFGAGWTFDADDGQMVTVEDADYTRYGWWAYKRKDQTYRVGVFYAHVGPTASDVATAPGTGLGTATYNGSAAGKYAIDNRPTGTILDAGHFEATATIMADLGATPTVSGTINNFMAGGEARDWSVALGKTGITWATGDDFTTVGDTADAAAGTVGAGAANVWTIGDVKGDADGDWQGGFYHDGDARLDDTPSNVLGSFTASHGTNAYMVGAFGAANLADDRPASE